MGTDVAVARAELCGNRLDGKAARVETDHPFALLRRQPLAANSCAVLAQQPENAALGDAVSLAESRGGGARLIFGNDLIDGRPVQPAAQTMRSRIFLALHANGLRSKGHQ